MNNLEAAMSYIMVLEPDQLRAVMAHTARLHADALGAWPTSDVLRRIADRIDAQVPFERMAAVAYRVAASHGLTFEDLRGPSRQKRIVLARQEAMYEMRRVLAPDGHPRFSFPAIGECLNRDHSTVVWGVAQHGARLTQEPRLERAA